MKLILCFILFSSCFSGCVCHTRGKAAKEALRLLSRNQVGQAPPAPAPAAGPIADPAINAVIQAATLAAKSATAAAQVAMQAAGQAAAASAKVAGATNGAADYTKVATTVYYAAKTGQVASDQTLNIARKLTPPFIYMQSEK